MTNTVQDTAAPTLLVPIALEALLVNDKVNDNIAFSLWKPNYGNLSDGLQSPLTTPFDDEDTKPDNGVYLHWILPDALTHGTQSQTTSTYFTASPSDQTFDYPLVPNRWLVARIASNATLQPSLKAWVVQSDYLGTSDDPSKNGSNPFVTPSTQTFEVTNMGKNFDLESWTEPSTPLFLKAVGPGNITFSAYTYAAMDVFAFCDTLKDLPDASVNTYNLSYIVIGWYSDPSSDPLQAWTTADQWTALMEQLNWVTNPADRPVAELPKRTLYHGMAYGVNWQNQTLPDRSNLDPTQLRLAVGNTGIDAFSALLEKVGNDAKPQVKINSDLLEAFQYDLMRLLNEADGVAQLAYQTCQTWYASSPSGIYWKIVPTERSNLDNTDEVTAQITPEQAAKLAQLNAIQAQLNQIFLQLQSRQTQLYDLWWKQLASDLAGYSDGNTPENGIDDPAWDTISKNIADALDETKPDSLIANVKQLLQVDLPRLVAQVPNPADENSISTYTKNVLQLPPDTLQLKHVPMPRFYEPTDPVLMVGGIEWPDRYIFGGITNENAPLPTRFQDQTLTGLKVNNTVIQATDSQLAGAIPLLSTTGQSKVPSGLVSLITALLQEAFFVDPASASIIATKYSLDAQTVKAAIVNPIQQQVGTRPAELAIFQWKQAWSPLFLEWEVTWYPTPPVISIDAYNPDHDKNPTIPTTTASINWTFDGQDYIWTGNAPTNADPLKTYKGRIFLSPHITFGFIARLKQYLANPNNSTEDLQAINQLIDQIGEWNFLSQTLSGFCHDLIMKDISQTVPPNTPLAANQDGISDNIPAYVGSEYHASPYTDPGSWTDPIIPNPPRPFDYFFPIRAGHFMFDRLRIVDRFGQTLNLLRANNNPVNSTDPVDGPEMIAKGFQPIYGKGLKPDSSSFQPYFLKQPPRLVQPSQLDFRFVSASDDNQQTDLNPAANPVCGWLLPNHLDQSLAMYDAKGSPLGELMLIAASNGGYTVGWQSAPGVTPGVMPDQIANPHLRQFVQGILGLGNSTAELQSLLQVIDETLWTIDPLGIRGDQELSALIGRPIAVVRAKLQFQLNGDPVVDQAWSQTVSSSYNSTTSSFRHITDVFTNVTFPVRLGSLDLRDDGLLGYFLNDNYQQFNTVHPGTNSSYIVPIGANNYIQLPISFPGKTNNNQPAFVTMLLDSRACIHATTGLQPPKTLTLPATYTKPIAKLDVTFQVNSLLTDADTIRLPIPSLKQGNWSWIEPSDLTNWNTTLPIVQANQKPRLAKTPPIVRDGWLKLETQEPSS